MTSRHDLVVTPAARPLSGSVPAPPDEDLGHLTLLIAALGEGVSEIRRLSSGPHVTALLAALRALGVKVDRRDAVTVVEGRGVRGLVHPGQPVACAASAATVRRLAAVLVGHPFATVLTTDAGLALPGMTAVAGALRRRAAQIEGTFGGARPGDLVTPFTVGPLALDNALSGVEYELGEPRFDVKETLLLSGFYADEATFVREPLVSRDHLERMLLALGAPLSTAGAIAAFDPTSWNAKWPAFNADVPGDVAAATLLTGVAALIPESRVCVRGVGQNPTRTGAFDVLRQMGGAVEVTPEATQLGEIEGTVCAAYAPLRAVTIAEELLLRATDDGPVLVALAARARGVTELVGLDLQVEMASRANPIAATARIHRTKGDGAIAPSSEFADILRAFGVMAEARDGGLVIDGRPDTPLESADIDAAGDAGRAALGVMLALVAKAPCRVRGVDGLAARLPRIVGMLRALGADVRVEPQA